MADSPLSQLVKRAVVQPPKAIDICAARVVFFPNEDLTEGPRFARFNGMELPPRAINPANVDVFAGFQGLRRGRLVAMQFSGYTKKGKPVFLMLCDCGRYAFRKIEKWALKAATPDACSICQQTQAVSHKNKSREMHGIRRAAWIASLCEAGLTPNQCNFIEKYSLDTDDLQWLKGALAEIESHQAGGK